MKTISKYLLSAVVAVALAACSGGDKDYDATGTFEATEVTVSAKTSGELSTFSIVEGQEVEKDVVLGNIDVTQLRLQKEELNATRSRLDADSRNLEATRRATESKSLDPERQVASLRQQIENAKRERQRYSELVADGAVPSKQLDDINYQISVLQKQLDASIEQLNATNSSIKDQSGGITAQIEGLGAQRSGLDTKEAQLDDLIANAMVKSPVTGTVLEKYVERGEYVTVGKPLFKVADTRLMTLRAYVTSAQLSKVKVGDKVTVYSDYGKNEGHQYAGEVIWISPKAEFTPKTIPTEDERADMVYVVKIQVKNDGYLKIGMYGKVKF